MRDEPRTVYAFLKPAIDAHTLGLISAAELLRDCGYQVEIAPHPIQEAIVSYQDEHSLKLVLDWLENSKARHFALSYRLDGRDAKSILGRIMHEAQKRHLFLGQGGKLEQIFYAGLPDACAIVSAEFGERIVCFGGGESPGETLKLLSVPEDRIPVELKKAGKYDESLLAFGHKIIEKQDYQAVLPVLRDYPEVGTTKDSLLKRLTASQTSGYSPVMRAHVGPYDASLSRRENVDTFLRWTKELAGAGFLDVLSIGSSQLSQSRFGDSWDGLIDGGGVPLASSAEYREVWEAARPMLCRTYAGTRDLSELVAIYEDSLHTAWHAMSIWWFNRLDERGPYTLYQSLQEQLRAIRLIAKYKTPFEANVSHHFAFRGSDDVSYIVSAYLSAKYAKSAGVSTFIAQNMLGTPRSTWAITDIAKSRALLRLLNEIADKGFRIIHQPRAGLDYFKPELKEAKAQLAAVSALMDDIDPTNDLSPPMIHVVSYSEAAHLADPAVINESIRITKHAIDSWREERRKGYTADVIKNPEIREMEEELYSSAKHIIAVCEKLIPNLYSPDGFYLLFASGFLPVPYLWRDQDEFRSAIDWKTKVIRGRVRLIGENDLPLSDEERTGIASENLAAAERNLNSQKKTGILRL